MPDAGCRMQDVRAGHTAGRGGRRAARESRRVLVLFSGAYPYARPDGLGTFLTKNGFDVTLWSTTTSATGGGSNTTFFATPFSTSSLTE